MWLNNVSILHINLFGLSYKALEFQLKRDL